jgi:hypothetical protein
MSRILGRGISLIKGFGYGGSSPVREFTAPPSPMDLQHVDGSVRSYPSPCTTRLHVLLLRCAATVVSRSVS